MKPSSILSIPALIALLPAIAALPTTTPHLAPLSSQGEIIPDKYIVVLKKGVEFGSIQAHLDVVQQAHSEGLLSSLDGITKIFQPTTHSQHGFYGYAGQFSQATLDLIRSSPEVEYVEHDQVVRLDFGTESFDSQPRGHVENNLEGLAQVTRADDDSLIASDGYNITHQRSAPWGLSRISHRPHLTLSTLMRYDYSTASLSTSHDPQGVDVYVVDTGINVAHVEFQGRAKWGKTIPSGSKDYDGNGHGSHCAGTIGSRAYGVDKGVNLWAVKVLSDQGSGTLSDVVSGISWAAEHAEQRAKAAEAELAATGKTAYKGAVISMSLGGGKSAATDDAVDAATQVALVAVAAGNDNKDACDYSPARAKKAITVGASTLGDERAYFSNLGKCVDIFAPGLNILSVWTNGNMTSNTISGTSMATPHIAGLGAYLLSVYGTETLPYMTARELAKLDKIAGSTLSESALIETILAQTPAASIQSVASSSSSSVYSVVYSAMPRLAQALFPTPATQLEAVAPVDKVITTIKPNQLKGLLISLSSKGLLSGVGEGSPNLLAFNNATSVPSKKN